MNKIMNKIRASKCTVVYISKQTEEAFLNKYHYQGYRPSTVCYGLKDEESGLIVQVMSFCKPRYNKSYDWELLRLCTKTDYQVYGGASKLLQVFQSNYKECNVISYCNESKFSGNVYKALGFERIGSCKSYHYEKDGVKYHRSQFQRWKLEKLFPQYSRDEYTEFQVMEAEGYTKVDEIQATWVLGQPNDKWYVYKITLDDGSVYIGQHRYHNEINDGYVGSGTLLKNKLKHHKVVSREILVKDITSQDLADKYERCAIAISRITDSNINICNGGHGYIGNGVRGCWDISSDEYSKRMSEIKKARTQQIPDEERRIKFGSHNRGRTPWNKGRMPSEEQINKQRETLLKYYQTHSGPNKGRKMNEETKAKMIATKKARIQQMTDEERRIKFGSHNRSFMQTPEYKAKMSSIIKERFDRIKDEYRRYKEDGGELNWNEFQKAVSKQ